MTVTRNLDDSNCVGMSFDDSTTATTVTFDNFTLAQVPEPGAAVLLFGGLALLGWLRCQ